MSALDPNLPHDSRAGQVIGICSTMLVLVTLVVAARFWIRLSLAKSQLGADDWCILAAWVLAAAFDLDPLNQVKFGLGQHIYDLSPDTNFSASLELYYFGEIIYYICVAITKVAILLLYLRLATSKRLRIIIWILMAFVIGTAFGCVMATIFQCTPIHKAWEVPKTDVGSCITVNALFYANAGLDIFQDIAIYILPMKMLYQLQLPKRQKIALMMVFAVGGFVVVTGMVRLYYLKGAQASLDPSYDNFGGAVWSSIESNIGVVCASLPHFKPLFDRFFPSLMGRSRGTHKQSQSSIVASGSQLEIGKYMKHPSPTHTEFELESGKRGWGGGHSGGPEGNFVNNIEVSARPFDGHSSEEHLRKKDSCDRDTNGIYQSTSVFINRDPMS